MHKILDEFEFRSDRTTDYGVSCPWMSKKFPIDLKWENGVCMLAHSFLIKSSSKLLVTRTGIKARMSLISGLWFPWPVYIFFEMRFDLGTLDSGEWSLPLGLLVVLPGRKPRRQVFSWRGSYNIRYTTILAVSSCAASWQNQQNGMCAQRRLWSAWASAQSDQSLRCPHEENLGPELPTERTAKTDQTGQKPSLIWVFDGRIVILLVLSWGGSFDEIPIVWSPAMAYLSTLPHKSWFSGFWDHFPISGSYLKNKLILPLLKPPPDYFFYR